MLPVLDLVLTWNKGISYGLFQQDSAFGQWALFGLKVVGRDLPLGLAGPGRNAADGPGFGPNYRRGLGNAIDRLAYGAVMDFVHLHTPGLRIQLVCL